MFLILTRKFVVSIEKNSGKLLFSILTETFAIILFWLRENIVWSTNLSYFPNSRNWHLFIHFISLDCLILWQNNSNLTLRLVNPLGKITSKLKITLRVLCSFGLLAAAKGHQEDLSSNRKRIRQMCYQFFINEMFKKIFYVPAFYLNMCLMRSQRVLKN